MRSRIFLTLLLVSAAGCKETVLHGIDESRANQITILLEQEGIESSKHAAGPNWDLRVSRNDLAPALRVIERSRLLTRGENRYKRQESSFIPNDSQQLQTAERQLAWSIEETLERIPGVIEAKVHLWLNKPTQLGLSNSDSSARSASALLLTAPTATLDIEELKRLVGGATGAPHSAISIVTHAVQPRHDAVEVITAPERSADRYPLFLIPAAILLTLVLSMWGYRRRRRSKRRMLSPAEIRRSFPEPNSPYKGDSNAGIQ